MTFFYIKKYFLQLETDNFFFFFLELKTDPNI